MIPTQGVIQHTGEMPSSPVSLNVAAGISADKTETFTLFQDAGEGYGYRGNDWSETKLTHSQASLKIGRTGNFIGQRIKFLEIIGVSFNPSEVRADGRKLDHKFNAAEKRVSVELTGTEKEIMLIR